METSLQETGKYNCADDYQKQTIITQLACMI